MIVLLLICIPIGCGKIFKGGHRVVKPCFYRTVNLILDIIYFLLDVLFQRVQVLFVLLGSFLEGVFNGITVTDSGAHRELALYFHTFTLGEFHIALAVTVSNVCITVHMEECLVVSFVYAILNILLVQVGVGVYTVIQSNTRAEHIGRRENDGILCVNIAFIRHVLVVNAFPFDSCTKVSYSIALCRNITACVAIRHAEVNIVQFVYADIDRLFACPYT